MDPMDRLDPELIEPLKGLMEATGGGFDLSDIPATRAMVKDMLAASHCRGSGNARHH